MRRIILAILIATAGCHRWDLQPGQTIAPPEQTSAGYPPYAQGPCYIEGCYDPCNPCFDPSVCVPGYGGEYVIMEPGAAYVMPGQAAPAAPSAPPPSFAAPMAPLAPPRVDEPGWFDVLPNGPAAISPDFGLPSAPVVENALPNPMVIRVVNSELAWDQMADVVSSYFPISREQPVQLNDGVLTEGYLQTAPRAGATIFEPFRKDVAGSYNRWESTLQSIRRHCYIRVTPTANGWAVEPQVFKELEDVPRPEYASAGDSSVRYDNSLPTDRRAELVQTRDTGAWIPLGRDQPLEQKMLREIYERLTGAPIE